MATKINIDDQIKLVINFQADKKEYQEWRNRIQAQFLKTVEVPGFRKGKAPEHLALKHINPQALEQTIISEAINKYSAEAIKDAKKDLEDKKRLVIDGSYIIDPSSLKSEDGFEFNINAELLPEIEVDPTKLKIKKVSEKDIPDRVSLKDFLASQKNGFIASHTEFQDSDKKAGNLYKIVADTSGTIDGKEALELTAKDMEGVLGIKQFIGDFETGIIGMKKGDKKEFDVTFPNNYGNAQLAGKKARFNVHLKELKEPVYTKFDDVVTKVEQKSNSGQNFENEKAFDDYIKNYYDQETKQITEQQWQRNAIVALTEQIKDFAMDEDRITAERDRIFNVIKTNSENSKISISESFAGSGIPGSDKKVKDEMEVSKLIEQYVRNEFKLSTIWEFIYESKVEKKVTSQDIDKAAAEVQAKPERFNTNKDVTEDQAKNIAFNQLKKQKAAQWLFGGLKKQDKEDEGKEAKK